MTKILAIDSSTEACSVALLDNNQEYQRYQLAPRKHAELLLPMVDEILKEAGCTLEELDAIACCVGPGAFTGLRIAVSVAQGLAFASGLPCIAISSLEMLAVKAFKQTKEDVCLCAIDARMQEVYFAVFERFESSRAKIIGSEGVYSPLEIDFRGLKSFVDLQSSMVKIGSGWFEYEYHLSINEIDAIQLEDKFPNAVDMLETAKVKFEQNIRLKPEELQPIYIRNNVAKKKLLKKSPIMSD